MRVATFISTQRQSDQRQQSTLISEVYLLCSNQPTFFLSQPTCSMSTWTYPSSSTYLFHVHQDLPFFLNLPVPCPPGPSLLPQSTCSMSTWTFPSSSTYLFNVHLDILFFLNLPAPCPPGISFLPQPTCSMST